MLRTLCNGLARGIGALCVTLLLVIIVALSVQIGARYLFDHPIHYTDAIAEIGLTWLTFLGAALLYRERGHIAVDLLSGLMPPRLHALLVITLQVAVGVVLVVVAQQISQVAETMSRVSFGVLPHSAVTSKFAVVMAPLLAGTGLTLLFIVERIVDEVRLLVSGEPEEIYTQRGYE